MIKFNSINQAVFNSSAPEFNAVESERADIVTCGRLLMMEHTGKSANILRKLENRPEEYAPVLTGAPGSGRNYGETNKNLQAKLMMYCAKRACAVTGEIPPADFQEMQKQQRKFLTNSIFLKTLSGVVRDIVTPILPITYSSALDWMAEIVSVPPGQTYELDVMSNDIFVFQDDSWGASRSKPSNYLYSYPITLNPTLRTAKATIKWYQLVGNDADMGAFFNAISAGMYNKNHRAVEQVHAGGHRKPVLCADEHEFYQHHGQLGYCGQEGEYGQRHQVPERGGFRRSLRLGPGAAQRQRQRFQRESGLRPVHHAGH